MIKNFVGDGVLDAADGDDSASIDADAKVATSLFCDENETSQSRISQQGTRKLHFRD